VGKKGCPELEDEEGRGVQKGGKMNILLKWNDGRSSNVLNGKAAKTLALKGLNVRFLLKKKTRRGEEKAEEKGRKTIRNSNSL